MVVMRLIVVVMEVDCGCDDGGRVVVMREDGWL